ARRAIASGTAPSEIAVLYRFNASQARFEAAFARFDIPTVVAEDTPFFEREEIRAVLIPFGQAARRQPETNGLQLLSELLDRTGFDRDSPPAGLGSARSRWESQVALVEVLEGLPEASGRDASWLLSQVNELARRTGDQGSGGVTLATLHRAKGLEWDVVFVVGVTDGAIPSAFATTHAEQAEEERLLHVGVTRARHELHLTWPAANPRGWANRPSPVLDLLRLAPRPDRKTSGGRTRREDLRPGRIATKGSPHQAHCALCAAALKGASPRRLGICADCAVTAPGDLGKRARLLSKIAATAASEVGEEPDRILSPDGLLRLLDKKPQSVSELTAVLGVRLSGEWAQAAVEALH
ncbi:MAG: 3'-5' exonuclease, partial [Acidimicrobiales bacterium]